MKASCKVIGVIPARYQSTRLPFKLLRPLQDKPLLQWTWENAARAKTLDQLLIACDDPALEAAARGFGAQVILTSPQHKSGTDRIAEAVSDRETQIVVNIQADEPLIHPSIIDRLANEMLENDDCVMATVCKRITDPYEVESPSTVKVVRDKFDYALYFSRYAIPYYREGSDTNVFYKHIGIYAYTKDFLYTFKNLPSSCLEQAEKLEQLRALEAGYRIKVVETQFESWGVDTEDDFRKVESILNQKST